jgi:hypothetical protein
MDDEEYEAELQARAREMWAALTEKAKADGKDVFALQHLWWRRDAKDWERFVKLVNKPDMTLGDRDYLFSEVGEIADRLRAARDNPEQRERDRWRKLMFCAAVIGSSEHQEDWLENARDFFAATRGPDPGEDAPPLAQATFAIECLLDALLMKPNDRLALRGKTDAMFREWAGENGIRSGAYNASGKFEMFGQIIPFKAAMNGQRCFRHLTNPRAEHDRRPRPYPGRALVHQV